MNSEFIVLAVREHDHLFNDICHYLDKDPGIVEWTYFADNTFAPDIKANVRQKDVYIVLTMDKNPSRCLEKCYELIDAARRARPNKIVLVMPEHPSQRQDKRHAKRESISVARHAKVFKALGVDHAICIELHAPQIEGLYDSLDNLSGAPFFADYMKKSLSAAEQDNLVIISPDGGGMRSAAFLSKNLKPLDIDIGFIQKERTGTNISKSGKVVGDVKDKVVVLYDDMLDTGGTILAGAEACKNAGARKIIACIAHALCNNRRDYDPSTDVDIIDKMADSLVDEFVFLNTRHKPLEIIEFNPKIKSKVSILDISKYLAEAIRRDQSGETIREMVKSLGVDNLYSILHKSKD